MDEDDSRRNGKSKGRRKGNGIKSKKPVEKIIERRRNKEGKRKRQGGQGGE